MSISFLDIINYRRVKEVALLNFHAKGMRSERSLLCMGWDYRRGIYLDLFYLHLIGRES